MHALGLLSNTDPELKLYFCSPGLDEAKVGLVAAD